MQTDYTLVITIGTKSDKIMLKSNSEPNSISNEGQSFQHPCISINRKEFRFNMSEVYIFLSS